MCLCTEFIDLLSVTGGRGKVSMGQRYLMIWPGREWKRIIHWLSTSEAVQKVDPAYFYGPYTGALDWTGSQDVWIRGKQLKIAHRGQQEDRIPPEEGSLQKPPEAHQYQGNLLEVDSFISRVCRSFTMPLNHRQWATTVVNINNEKVATLPGKSHTRCFLPQTSHSFNPRR